jgi:hypothetical protein
MLKKIWNILLPVIVIVNFALAISNLISTRSNNLMLIELLTSVR